MLETLDYTILSVIGSTPLISKTALIDKDIILLKEV